MTEQQLTVLDQEALKALEFLAQEGTDEQVDEKLRELAASAFGLDPRVISIWLRLTRGRQHVLPSWWPLLNRGVEVCRQVGVDPAHCFHGLGGMQKVVQRNTY